MCIRDSSDTDLGNYVAGKLALPGEERNEHRGQVNRLLEKLEGELHSDGSYRIKKFRRAGSLEKGTSNRPRAGKPVDADIGVYFDADPEDFDTNDLQARIKRLLVAAYPQKSPEDFEVGARTFSVVFKAVSYTHLDVYKRQAWSLRSRSWITSAPPASSTRPNAIDRPRPSC